MFSPEVNRTSQTFARNDINTAHSVKNFSLSSPRIYGGMGGGGTGSGVGLRHSLNYGVGGST